MVKRVEGGRIDHVLEPGHGPKEDGLQGEPYLVSKSAALFGLGGGYHNSAGGVAHYPLTRWEA